ncbi:hypothetical protein [Leptothoe spongobia]|uniref:NfeD family protein n=1 Tax=Leptothoe spongobia TAU-MAC 1115 TaxID=1967444 RepID=A0A947GQ25_9CYAN|nr:hypothetical protein [Leptothoe spongobia]MBT9316856.1 NfeD family protein [Leptothoe spongobia TAU-MAC 1115]
MNTLGRSGLMLLSLPLALAVIAPEKWVPDNWIRGAAGAGIFACFALVRQQDGSLGDSFDESLASLDARPYTNFTVYLRDKDSEEVPFAQVATATVEERIEAGKTGWVKRYGVLSRATLHQASVCGVLEPGEQVQIMARKGNTLMVLPVSGLDIASMNKTAACPSNPKS